MNGTSAIYINRTDWNMTEMDPVSPNNTEPFLFSQRVISKALDVLSVIVLFIVMMSLGCTMKISKIRAHFTKPKGIGIAVIAQYGIMPLTALALANIFQLSPTESLAVLICGCCPGGNLSNILCFACKGDMNLSIVMTTCSTFLAFGMMPLLLYIYSMALGQGNIENMVPYLGIVFSLVMTLVPCAIGIFLNEKKPQYSRCVIKFGMATMILASIAIIILSAKYIGSTIVTVFSPPLVGTAALMPGIGYLLGYLFSTVFKLNARCKRTVSVETGCQNVQLCTAILKVAFTPEVMGSLYLFPFLYLLFQAGEGLLLILVFKCYGMMKAPTAVSNPIYTSVKDLKEEPTLTSLSTDSSADCRGLWMQNNFVSEKA
ncbi:hepatic sodium/bile acid cotransporter [Microcaecilia unicolor]|uniref:Hepatic sodium/bile acid cotransporter n=1 Tax=Microcaecilia unicolor TaxID=1415580 RepID=A0A6P7YV07_9AMPH|nr:sodium/bile acid cotransporter [Microcaecilia unicolor]